MKTSIKNLRFFLGIGILLLSLQVNAQTIKRAKTNTNAINRVPLQQTQTTPEPNDPSILYKKLPARVLDLPTGEDGDHAHEHEREPISRANFTTALRSRTPLPQANLVWNNAAFGKSNPLVTSEAPVAMRARSGASYCSAPIVDASKASVYAKVKAHMPLYLPYRNSKTTVWQGFYYNDGGYHGSIDYGKSGIKPGEDPTFGVYAIAGGKVVDVGWTNGGGNFVEIEHTAPNGFKYRSRYIHLRNGYSNDRNKTKALSTSNADYAKVVKYAKKNGNKLSWGNENHKVRVRKGQSVKTGQFLAWAGNTGVGGIKFALDNNGNFKNSNTRSFNVHLHFSLYVKDTRPGYSGWIKVDPYGAYTKDKGNACYDLGSNTAYNRLFAPFYPTFHNVPLDLINTYWGYYTGMGMSMQTISVTRNSKGKLMAAGSFQWGLSKSWYARFYMTGKSFQYYFDFYRKKNFRPRQINTTRDSNNKLRYSVIWEKNPSGEAYYCFFGRSDSNFSQLWNTYIKNKKYHLAEHNTYNLGGTRYHAGVFVKSKSSNAFYTYYGMSSSAFNAKFKSLSSKWQLTSLHVNGSTVGGVWRPKKKQYAAYYGMSSSAYQSRASNMASNGYRLYKVQNYSNNGKFAAIWVKK